ncbi:MAG: hypothetical protein JXA60_03400 [Candidatus Coatesbacteria bacterium]|nr:hypothetical protein [Candidatus Coatesbacteria bacterium]
MTRFNVKEFNLAPRHYGLTYEEVILMEVFGVEIEYLELKGVKVISTIV